MADGEFQVPKRIEKRFYIRSEGNDAFQDRMKEIEDRISRVDAKERRKRSSLKGNKWTVYSLSDEGFDQSAAKESALNLITKLRQGKADEKDSAALGCRADSEASCPSQQGHPHTQHRYVSCKPSEGGKTEPRCDPADDASRGVCHVLPECVAGAGRKPLARKLTEADGTPTQLRERKRPLRSIGLSFDE
eukprot:GHVU01032962.1.p1 GENE.GHVU01032962.1~~GHVU01032962.1.p1  ORF type:complete len:190 (+),score=21.26 GHVU01032962.1:270-839(+)